MHRSLTLLIHIKYIHLPGLPMLVFPSRPPASFTLLSICLTEHLVVYACSIRDRAVDSGIRPFRVLHLSNTHTSGDIYTRIRGAIRSTKILAATEKKSTSKTALCTRRRSREIFQASMLLLIITYNTDDCIRR